LAAGRRGRSGSSLTGLTAARCSSTTTRSLNAVWHFAHVTRTIHADSSLPSTRISEPEWLAPQTLHLYSFAWSRRNLRMFTAVRAYPVRPTRDPYARRGTRIGRQDRPPACRAACRFHDRHRGLPASGPRTGGPRSAPAGARP